MVTAVSCAKVPKLTVILGGSFGAGNYGMCGRAFNPRFLWTWPNARISVMGGEAGRVGPRTRAPATASRPRAASGRRKKRMPSSRRFASSTRSRAIRITPPPRLWDDGVIDPADTRRELGLALAAGAQRTHRGTRFGVFRM
jgi:3-methylcrotonyl-CoA carboxylase beta subunit